MCARVISKPVIVTMIPELLAIGIDQPRIIASGFFGQWEQTRVPDLSCQSVTSWRSFSH